MHFRRGSNLLPWLAAILIAAQAGLSVSSIAHKFSHHSHQAGEISLAHAADACVGGSHSDPGAPQPVPSESDPTHECDLCLVLAQAVRSEAPAPVVLPTFQVSRQAAASINAVVIERHVLPRTSRGPPPLA